MRVCWTVGNGPRDILLKAGASITRRIKPVLTRKLLRLLLNRSRIPTLLIVLDRRLNKALEEDEDEEERNKEGDEEEERVLLEASRRKPKPVSNKGKGREVDNEGREDDDQLDKENQQEEEGNPVASTSHDAAPRPKPRPKRGARRRKSISADVPGTSQTLVNINPLLQDADEGEGQMPDGHRSASPGAPAVIPEADGDVPEVPFSMEEMMEQVVPSPSVRRQPIASTSNPSPQVVVPHRNTRSRSRSASLEAPRASTSNPSPQIAAPYRNTRSRSRSASVEAPPYCTPVPPEEQSRNPPPAPPPHTLSPLPEVPGRSRGRPRSQPSLL
ncbi:hypothetical protein BT96DRAFT_75642 [Gymnopus androsaceus JB14]|uniref:Uncharacterized protein n=1 Tax=Gymnopus androsaceus JB14 TaxID=1447944 RepID=A0A6A4HIM8_9AGAR|nr:hypothetical protein BT96DRAFT_75642 [Gymnopus androsaceus JB14]